MQRLARPGLARTSAADLGHALFGCDGTQGIVSVEADTCGRALVWRRSATSVESTEHRFPNWFLTTTLDLLAHLPAERLGADALRTAHGDLRLGDGLAVLELDGHPASDEDAYRFLVLTSRLDEVQTAIVETVNKRESSEAETLADLRGLVLIWPPVEQFLMLTGRTYFKGMQFSELHRLQFDLETTGLNEDRDRIFMIGLRDSRGWQDCLDTGSMTEGEVIERFVAIVNERDPDVLENHNVFAFDLPFLVKRAARLGVRLALGRDGTEPWLESDVFDNGDRPEPFLRWRVAGRQVVDTQHAVRRFAAAAPDLRRHGLKDAARYFGLARPDREYVAGAEVWPTYRADPQRVRRYAADDVDEVDGLSRRLLPAVFGLASMLPRPYERLAADCGPASLWELLLVRGYLHAGRAIAAPAPRLLRAPTGPRAELFVTGVVGPAARAVARPLLPSVIAGSGITSPNDELGLLPTILRVMLERDEDDSARVLAAAAHAYLAGQGLFSEPQTAADVSSRAREYMEHLVRDLRALGCCIVEVDGEQVLFATADRWGPDVEHQVARAARAYLPDGVRLGFDGHYGALYARGPRSAIMLGLDGTVTLVGNTFRPGRLERFGEAFMHRAAPYALLGDILGLRRVFLETVHKLRTAQLPLEDLAVQVTLRKSLPQYRRGGTHEEAYEVLLAAGVRSWRVGQRIRYFRGRGGEPRLLQEGDGFTAADADTEYYVQRLVSLYCHQFAQAFERDDFRRMFRVPAGDGPFDESECEIELASVRPIATVVAGT